MITIRNGKLNIPEFERFIGFAGDNLNRTIEFLISGATEADRIYRIYLTFDDGTCNYFVLPSEVTDKGVLITWNIKLQHIFKSGIVKAQIKAFSNSGVVYHTTSDTFIVGDSAELTESFLKENSEFLEYEKRLNDLATFVSDICVMTPYIGNNGNWYIYDSEAGTYVDSGKPSVSSIQSADIKDKAVTTVKLADGAVTAEKIADYAVTNIKLSQFAVNERTVAPNAIVESKIADAAVTSDKIADNAIDSLDKFTPEMIAEYFALPLVKNSRFGSFSDADYNALTDPGIYQMDSAVSHEVVIVLKPSSNAHLMQFRISYNKVEFRGIWCTIDGVYADEDWDDWVELTKNSATEINELDVIGGNFTLVNNAEYRYKTELESLWIYLPSGDIPSIFESSIVFRSGAVATALTSPSSIKWSGDDVVSITATENGESVTYNCLVPQVNKTYNVIFWYDGFNMNAVARGVGNE